MLTETRYRCPGEGYEIGRAEHLARLADGYAGCDHCPHRADLSHLPASAARRLAVRPQARASLVGEAGVGGVAFNEFSPREAEQWCRAFGQMAAAAKTTAARIIALANDARPLAPEFVAAAAQGLRWAGCEVLELSAATSATLDWARRRRQAAGSVLVGNPLGQPQTCGLRFWLSEGEHGGAAAWSSPGMLDRLAATVAASPPRPRGAAPGALRGAGDAEYLDALRPLYHGLRPLRFACESHSRPLLRLLENLLAPTGCQMLTPEAANDSGASVHFRFEALADGEACRVWDETGREASPAALAALVARRVLADAPGAVAALGEDLTAAATAVTAAGGRVLWSAPTREAVSRRLAESAAVLGATAGCIWLAGSAAPDALAALSQLLSILSESDAPLSARLAHSCAL